MYQIEMGRAPGITEEERRRRIHRVYEILLSAARKKMDDAPAEVAEPATGASGANLGDQRPDYTTVERDSTHLKER